MIAEGEVILRTPKLDVTLLAVPGMDVRWRLSPPGCGAHLDCGELLDVDEKRDVELRGPQDDFALCDHVPAA